MVYRSSLIISNSAPSLPASQQGPPCAHPTLKTLYNRLHGKRTRYCVDWPPNSDIHTKMWSLIKNGGTKKDFAGFWVLEVSGTIKIPKHNPKEFLVRLFLTIVLTIIDVRFDFAAKPLVQLRIIRIGACSSDTKVRWHGVRCCSVDQQPEKVIEKGVCKKRFWGKRRIKLPNTNRFLNFELRILILVIFLFHFELFNSSNLDFLTIPPQISLPSTYFYKNIARRQSETDRFESLTTRSPGPQSIVSGKGGRVIQKRGSKRKIWDFFYIIRNPHIKGDRDSAFR